MPVGEMRYDDDRVQCHLGGRWLRLIGGPHLARAHGWTIDEYRDAFRLYAGTTTAAPSTSQLMRANMLRPINGTTQAKAVREQQRAAGIDPAVKGPRKVPRWRSLAVLRPDLSRDWHLVRNHDLRPDAIGPNSVETVWWRCATCGHEWHAKPATRSKGDGCPACARQRTGEATRARNFNTSAESSLKALRPDLLDEWHPTRNQDLDPSSISLGSHICVWWRCAICGHEWQSTPHSRSRAKGPGCRACSSRNSALERWRQQRARARAGQ